MCIAPYHIFTSKWAGVVRLSGVEWNSLARTPRADGRGRPCDVQGRGKRKLATIAMGETGVLRNLRDVRNFKKVGSGFRELTRLGGVVHAT